jgi:hypothetical protein
VPGCDVDLSKLKDFHLRCRVCKDHSKADSVVLSDGEDYRFCQQCNKFQALHEFEEGKRGCREKLLIHNIRCDGFAAEVSVRASVRSARALQAEFAVGKVAVFQRKLQLLQTANHA